MRVTSLTLDCYGPFSDRTLTFRPDARLHIVLGANEAGKTSALAALTDLLFGIDRHSLLIPPQEARALALSATIRDRAGHDLAFRRKRYKPALTRPDGSVLPDDALAPFLGGLSREIFRRAFGLDAVRLRDSGAELKETNGELGAALFSAASGLRGIRDLKTALEAEADGIFAPRASRERSFYQALDRIEKARKQVRERELRSDALKQIHDAIAGANALLAALPVQRAESLRRQAHLQRLRRVQPVLAAIDARAADLAALSGLPPAPEGVAAEGERLLAALAAAAEALRQAESTLRQREQDRAAITVDTILLARGDEVERLRNLSGAYLKALIDLPRVRSEADGFEAGLADLARRLGLGGPDDLQARRPTDAARAGLLARVGEGRTLLLRDEAARAAVTAARRKRDDLAAAVEPATRATDRDREHLAALAPILKRIADMEDAAAALAADRRDLDEAGGRLRPAPASLDALAVRPLPTRDEIAAADLRFQTADNDDRDRARQAATLARQTAELATRRAALAGASGPVTPERIAAARARRDGLWMLLRDRLTGTSRADPVADVAAFEHTVRDADALADTAFTDAARLAQLAEIDAGLTAQAVERDHLDEAMSAAIRDRAALDADWWALWAPLELVPLAPAAMREWRQDVETLLGRREQVKRRETAADATAAEAAAIAPALAALAADLGLMPMPGLSPVLLARRIEAELTRLDTIGAARRERAILIAEADRALIRAGEDASASADQVIAWREAFDAAAGALGVAPGALPDAVSKVLDNWSELPPLHRERDDRRQRVSGMQRDIAAFETEVAALRALVAADIDEPPEPALRRIVARLTTARNAETRRIEAEHRSAEATTAHETAVSVHERALAAVAALAARLAVEVTALPDLIARLKQRDERRRALKEARDRLSDVADGHPEDALRADLAGFDSVQADIDLLQLAAEDDQLDHAGRQVFALKQQQEAVLAERESGSGAEIALQQRRNAEAELLEAARDWAVLSVGAAMIGTAIERQRSSRQEPMMRAAGALFARLTDGAYAGLGQGFADDDVPRLVGLRRDGRELAVDHMSEGTRDQLFLALRLAFLDDFAARSEPAPFIGDDLFASFDDARTRHGLVTLAGLGDRLQTILFTHHAHVADIARDALGDAVEVLRL